MAFTHASATRVRWRAEEGETHQNEEGFLVFMALLVPAFPALVSLAAGVALGQVLARRPALKATFNVAQFTASAGIALALVEAFRPAEAAGPGLALAVMAGAFVFLLLNNAAISGALALAGAGSFRRVFAEDTRTLVLVSSGNVAIGLLAGLAAITHAWTLPFVLLAMAALSISITGHRRARHERQKFGGVIVFSSNAIVSVDRGGNVKTWNRVMERTTGRAAAAAVGRPLAEVLELRDSAGAAADGLDLSAPLERRLMRLASATGEERWLVISRSVLPDGGFLLEAQDVTELRLAEQALGDAEDRYRRLVEHLPLAVYVDIPEEADGAVIRRIAYIGPQIETMLGYPAGQWSEDPRLFARALHPADRERVLAEIRRARAGRAGFRGEYRLIGHDGRVVWVHDENVVMRDGDGRATSIEGCLVDISERKALEQDLLQAQKMEAVGRFAGGVAHDFNNVITAVMGFGELALHELEGQPKPQRHVEQVLLAGERASAMTKRLLAFSRKQVLEPRAVDLHELVAGAEPLLRQLIGVDIELAIDRGGEPATVHADAGQLEQVLVNLVVNARDAMPTGGTLTITTAQVQLDADHPTTHFDIEPGSYVRLAVTDTGVGIDPQTQARIFEPFFTTKQPGKGTGLGLATVFGIVKQSGGNIAVHSEVERGTTFTLHLPEVPVPAQPRAAWSR